MCKKVFTITLQLFKVLLVTGVCVCCNLNNVFAEGEKTACRNI